MGRNVRWQGRTVNRGSTRRASSSSSSGGQSMSHKISNYKTRFASVGVDVDKELDKRNAIEKALNLKKDQNALFDIFEILGRPQQALFGAINAAQKGKDVGKGALKGITGEKTVSGKDILKTAGMSDRKGKLDVSDVLGFGMDVFVDPLSFAVVPAKGATAAAKATKALDAAGDAQKALRAARAAGDATKIAKASEKVAKTAKAVDVTQDALKAASKSVLYNGGKATTSINNIIGKGVGKAAKGAIKGADKLIEAGLGVSDKAYESRLATQIDKATKTLDKAQKSGNVTKAVQAQSFLDELAKMEPTSKKLEAYKSFKKGVRETLDSNKALGGFVGRARQAAASEDVATNIQKEQIKSNMKLVEKEIKKVADTKGQKAADELRNMVYKRMGLADIIEYDRDYSVKGENILKGLGKNNPNEIKGIDDESLSKIKSYLGKNSIDFTDIDDGIKITQPDIGDIKSNPEMQKFFKDLNITKKHYYTPEQVEELDKGLKYFKTNYPDLYKQQKAFTGELAKTRNITTGTDFTGITDREGYLKKALSDSYADSKQYKGALDNLKGGGLINEKAYGGRIAPSGLEVENIIEEERAQALAMGENKIMSLESKMTKPRIESLELQKADIINRSTTEEKKLLKQLEKAGINKEKYTKGIDDLRQQRNIIKGKFSDTTIDKINKVKDQSLKRNLVRAQDDYFKATDQTNKILKQIESGTDNTKDLGKIYEQAKLNENKAYIKLQGHMDALDKFTERKTSELLSAASRDADKVAKNATKMDKLQTKLAESSQKYSELSNSLDDLIGSRENQLNQLQFKIDSLKNADPTRDEGIIKEISKIQQDIDILKSKEGQEIFKHQFNDYLNAFVDSSGRYAKGAKVYNEAVVSGTLTNPEFIKVVENSAEEVPTGFIKVSGDKLSKQLNAASSVLPENSELFKNVIDKYAGKDVYMDKTLATMLGMTNKSNESAKVLTKMLNKVNNTFKKFSVLTPGFQMRNMVGNWSNMYLAGMPMQSMPTYMNKATKVLNSSDDIFKKLRNGATLTAAEQKNLDLLMQFYEAGFDKAGDAVRDLEQLRGAVTKGTGPINKVAEFNMNMNSKMDNLNRMTMLMYANEHPEIMTNLGKTNPADVVRFALMDPNNMSEFEKNTLKKFIPFYTFTKQNLMFQADNIMRNTPKYAKLMHSINSLYDNLDENQYWDYQKESMQIPIPFGDGKNTLFLKTNLPLSDLGEWMSNPVQRLAASSNPLLKMSFETATGKDTYTGQDLNYKNTTKLLNALGVKNVPKDIRNTTAAAEHILAGLGLNNVSNNIVKKVTKVLESAKGGDVAPEALWAEIFRSILQNTNQDSVESVKQYQELQDYQQLMKELKGQGIDVPSIRDLTKSNKIKVTNLKRKRAIRSRY